MKACQVVLSVLLLLAPMTAADAEDSDAEYTLRYEFAPEETLRWKVVHLATNETTIRGNTQKSKSRSESKKLWEISEVDEQGNITLVHSVESVDMWQQLSDQPEVRYNSETDDEAPPQYEQVAKTVGVPITTVTMDPTGKILDRESNVPQTNFGLGDMVMLLPDEPVKAGSRWYEPSEIQVRLEDQRVKDIKIRKRYELEKVLTGVATISVKTEVLTPVTEPSVKAQLAQQLTQGTIRFDVDAGRVLSRKIDWDETVVGFNGPESNMKYLARFTEELIGEQPEGAEEAERTTARATRADKPALRRQ